MGRYMKAFSIHRKRCLDVMVGQIINGLERGFVKHQLNLVVITSVRDKEKVSLFFIEFISIRKTSKLMITSLV